MVNDNTHKPKRRLKWLPVIGCIFVLLVVCYVAYRLILHNRVQQRLAAIRAQGWPATLQELNDWYTEPPPGRNAADVLQDAFVSYDAEFDLKKEMKLPLIGGAELPEPGEALDQETKNLIAEYLETNVEALKLLHQGAAMKQCRYPIDMTQGIMLEIPHLAKLRAGARLLNLEAMLNAENGNPDKAVQAVVSSFGLAQSVTHEPLLLSQLSRIAFQAISQYSLERVLSRMELPEEHLITLTSAIREQEDPAAMSLAFVSERCYYGYDEPLLKGILDNAGESVWLPYSGSKAKMFLYHASGLFDLDFALRLDMMEEFIDVANLPFHQRLQACETLFRKAENLSRTARVFSRTALLGLPRTIRVHLNITARIRAAYAALAVERYRLANQALPENLKKLVPTYLKEIPVDPFDGQPLRYKKLDKGYVIYSVGENGIDDGGIKQDFAKSWQLDLDIIFTVPR